MLPRRYEDPKHFFRRYKVLSKNINLFQSAFEMETIHLFCSGKYDWCLFEA